MHIVFFVIRILLFTVTVALQENSLILAKEEYLAQTQR